MFPHVVTHKNIQTLRLRCRIDTSSLCHQNGSSMSRITQPNEPFFIANLQNQFADFPYPHYSINQRLMTLETCCGNQYGLNMIVIIFTAFQKPFKKYHTSQNRQCCLYNYTQISRQTYSIIIVYSIRVEISYRNLKR